MAVSLQSQNKHKTNKEKAKITKLPDVHFLLVFNIERVYDVWACDSGPGDLPNHLGFLPFQDADGEKSIEKNLVQGFYVPDFNSCVHHVCLFSLARIQSQSHQAARDYGKCSTWLRYHFLYLIWCVGGLAMRPRWSQTHGTPHGSVPRVVRLQTCTTTSSCVGSPFSRDNCVVNEEELKDILTHELSFMFVERR